MPFPAVSSRRPARAPTSLSRKAPSWCASYQDILEELNLTAVAQQMEMKELMPATDTESLLLKQLGAEPIHIDEICRTSGLPISTVSSTLAMMELKGLVKQVAHELRSRQRSERGVSS